MAATVFIYALNCPITGQTRYVGKSKDPQKRLSDHLSEKSRSHRTNWLRSLIALGKIPILEILDEVEESVWQQWEVAWIQFFRESGFDLVNGTDGGDGMQSPTAETRLKMRLAQLGKRMPVRSAEHCLKIGIRSKGKRHSAEAIRKMSLVRKQWWETKKGKS